MRPQLSNNEVAFLKEIIRNVLVDILDYDGILTIKEKKHLLKKVENW